MFKLFMIVGAMFWMLWQLKSYAMLFLVLLFLGGCHPAGSYDVVYMVEVEEEKPAEDTLIYIEKARELPSSRDMVVYEWSYECADFAYIDAPYHHDPSYCHYYADFDVECHWYFGYGDYEVWEWDDYLCQWRYLFDYTVDY